MSELGKNWKGLEPDYRFEGQAEKLTLGMKSYIKYTDVYSSVQD